MEVPRQRVDVRFVHLSQVSQPLAVGVVQVPSRFPKRRVQAFKVRRVEPVQTAKIRTGVEHLAEIDVGWLVVSSMRA